PPQTIELAGVGESWRVHACGGIGRPEIKVAGPGLLQLNGDLSNTRAVQYALRMWLMKRAAELFAPVLERTARHMNFPYRKLAVRRQRTRWGSCSARGTISLNCCLLFQRPEVLHYLLVHELAHVTHMNHSARFWDLVARYCPECRRLDRELLDGWRRV